MKYASIICSLVYIFLSACGNDKNPPNIEPKNTILPEPLPISEPLSPPQSYKHFISLGHNCHVATALDNLSADKIRYPWDWNWTTPEIIIDNINDNFAKYLDKTRYTECKFWRQDPMKGWIRDELVRGKCTGHLDYGYFFFRHHDLQKDDDYNSFYRRVARFNALKHNPEPKLFIYAALAEETPRQGGLWKSEESFGTGKFQMARYKDEEKIMDLYHTLEQHFDNFKMVVIINDWEKLKPEQEPYFDLNISKSIQHKNRSLDFYNLYTKSKNDRCLEYPVPQDQEKFMEIIKKYHD